jgi:hypothetical protein
MRRHLFASAVAGALTAFAAAASALGTTAALPVVHCDSGQAVPANPLPAATGRIVLGRLALPAAYLPDIVKRTDIRPFRWWRKAPLAIHATTTAVTISIPTAWRNRVAITYGDSGPAVHALRFASCPAAGTRWNGYPGGFFTTAPTCFPLEVTVGHRSTTIRTGMGVRCSTTPTLRRARRAANPTNPPPAMGSAL